jgi:type IX secretion system PorP/SprF family membrane protein
MMRMNWTYRLLSVILLIIGSFASHAQDPNFSQFYNNPVYYNPAMAAIGKGYTFRANARNLWAPIPGRFNTFSAAFEGELLNKVGIGVMGFSDVAGEGLLRTTGGYLTYTYRPVETKNFLMQFGLTGGLLNKSIDWERLTFSDQFDEVHGQVNPTSFIAPNNNSVIYPDFSTGMSLRFNSRRDRSHSAFKRMIATAGFAFHHLNQPKDAFINDTKYLPVKFVVHGTFGLLIGQNIISPGFIFERQNEFQTFTIGTSLVNKPISLGIWFRNRTYLMSVKSYDSFIFTAGTHLPLPNERNLRITYGIDFTISRLRTSSFGSHELSLVYDLDNRYLLKGMHAKKRKKKAYQCPDDFMGYD